MLCKNYKKVLMLLLLIYQLLQLYIKLKRELLVTEDINITQIRLI